MFIRNYESARIQENTLHRTAFRARAAAIICLLLFLSACATVGRVFQHQRYMTSRSGRRPKRRSRPCSARPGGLASRTASRRGPTPAIITARSTQRGQRTLSSDLTKTTSSGPIPSIHRIPRISGSSTAPEGNKRLLTVRFCFRNHDSSACYCCRLFAAYRTYPTALFPAKGRTPA